MKFKPQRVALALAKEVGSIKLDQFLQEFSKFCLDNYQTQNATKFDVSLLRALCNTLENGYEVKHRVDEKLDKKKVVIDQYIQLKAQVGVKFADEDKATLGSLIDDLHNSKQIRKVPLSKLWGRRLKTFLLG